MKAARRMLEQDLSLPKKGLDQQKDLVTELVDQVRCTCCMYAAQQSCMCAAKYTPDCNGSSGCGMILCLCNNKRRSNSTICSCVRSALQQPQPA